MDELTQEERDIIIGLLAEERHNHGDVGYAVMTAIIRKVQQE